MSNLKRIQVQYTGLPGLPGTSTWYGHEDGVSAADQVAAVLTFYTALQTTLRSGLTITVPDVVEIVDSTNGQTTGLDDTGSGGTVTCSNSGAVPAWGTQVLLQLRTGFYTSGRELRGRIFLPGITDNDIDSGYPSTAVIAAIQGHLDTLVGSANLAVYSTTHRTWASVSTGSVWGKFALMRSRRD